MQYSQASQRKSVIKAQRLPQLTSNQKEKAKRMKWFDRWFAKKCQQAWEDNRGEVPQALAVDETEMDHRNTIRFTVTPARGGSVVSIISYDERKDTNNKVLYVIDENEDIAKRIGEIVSMELLRS